MCKNRDFALYGLWRPYKATKSYFWGIINVWGSSLGSKRNLDIGFIMGYRRGFSRKMKKKQRGWGDLPPLSMGTRVKKIHQSQIKITHVKSRCCKILSGKYIIQVSIIYLEIIFTESSRTILINLENNITNLILESPKDIIPKTKLHHQYIQLQIFSN